MRIPARVQLCFWCLAALLTAGAAAGTIELRLPADLVYDQTVGTDGAVVFRHSTHVGFADVKCGACHPAPFGMLRPVRQATHEQMDKAQSCGVCHDGSRAFATSKDEMCARCHTGWGKTQEVYPPDATWKENADSPGPVTFRHATHRGQGVSCAECHVPKFKSGGAAGAPASPPSPHETCGSCHEGTRAFALEDDAGCPRCHVAGEAGR